MCNPLPSHQESLLLWALLGAFFLASPVGAAVSDHGTYQRQIDIQVPEFHAVTPGIRLLYDSSSGNGLLGVGWSLSVGSQISRSSPLGGAPRYDPSDQLWLDGMQLIPCASAQQAASCSNGGTHSSRIETYTRITHATGFTGGQPSSSVPTGGNTWTVWRRDGTRLRFEPHGGDVTSFSGAFQWLLADVVDTHGNDVHYDYNCGADLVCYVTDITYGAGKSCSVKKPGRPQVGRFRSTPTLPGADIHFYWEDRPDPQSVAVGGLFQTLSKRLRAVDVSQAGKRVRVYQLTYATEPFTSTGFTRSTSWLASIRTYGNDAQVSPFGVVLSGTTSDLAGPSFTFERPPVPDPSSGWSAATRPGNAPLASIGPANAVLPAVYDHRASNVLTPQPLTNEGRAGTVTGDFNADGQLEVLQWLLSADCNTVTLRVSTANLTDATNSMPWLGPQRHGAPPESIVGCDSIIFPVDLDGDGRTDLLFETAADLPNGSTEIFLIAALSKGDGGFTFLPPFDTSIADVQRGCSPGDFNGDKLTDLVCDHLVNGQLVLSEVVSTGGGQFLRSADTLVGNKKFAYVIADVNGDGRADVFGVTESAPSAAAPQPTFMLEVGLSQADGTFFWKPQVTTIPSTFANSEVQTNLLAGDFNADGRADLLLYTVDDMLQGSTLISFLSTGTDSSPFAIHQQTVTPAIKGSVSVGDADGDGRDDLLIAVHHFAHDASSCGVAIDHEHPSLYVANSLGDGTFFLPPSLDGCYSEVDWPWEGSFLSVNARAADVNGDGIADFFSWWQSGNQIVFADLPGQIPWYDQRRWHLTDLNGDGKPDWVYVEYANPGVTVISVITQPDGTMQRFVANIPSTDGDLSRSALFRQPIVADVGGPAGNPDGRADLVLIDDLGNKVTTLLNNGDGSWNKVTVPYSIVIGKDVGNWRVMDVDGDGRADLVHTTFLGLGFGTTGLRVETLRSRGDGHWDELGEKHFDGAYTNPDVRAFRPADINGDGLMDLVATEHLWSSAGAANMTVWSLISRGDGTWEEKSQTVSQPFIDTDNWIPVDINGDGRTDLVRLDTASSQASPTQPIISTMLSLADGSWQNLQSRPVSPTPPSGSMPLADVRWADLDGDGKPEIVELAHQGATSTVSVIWNRYPDFRQTGSPGLAVDSSDSLNWNLVGLDGDGHSELVHFHFDSSAQIDVITLPQVDSRMVRVAAGLGGVEDISYGTSAGQHADMPLGLIAHTVQSVGVRATPAAGPYDAFTTYTYTGATYARAPLLRRFIGFQQTESNDNTRIVSRTFDPNSACGGRLVQQTLFDEQRAPLRGSGFVFAPPGAGAAVGGLALCRTDQQVSQEWERASTPRTNTVSMAYDSLGNVLELNQTGDVTTPGDDRAIEMTVNANLTDYIVDHVASESIYALAKSSRRRTLMAQTRYEYDHSGDYRRPPASRGDLTRVHRWNDVTNRYIDTKFEYDQYGNNITATGPPTPFNRGGLSTTTAYDCEFERFPETISNPSLSTVMTWDKSLGVPLTHTDSNGSRTVLGYDALGRLTSVTRPDGSFEHWRWQSYALNSPPLRGAPIRHEISDGSPIDGVLWAEVFLDGLGRETRIEREGNIVQDVLAYDGATERVTQRSLPHFVNDAPEIVQTEYDPEGRLLKWRHADSSVRKIRYDLGLRTATDELGATKTYEVDSFNRITAVTENLRTCVTENCPIKASAVTRYGYDALDRLVSITDTDGHGTVYSWDSLGRGRRACDPDRGCVSFTWNDDGSQASETDANRSRQSWKYDSLGRPELQQSFDSANHTTREVHLTWDVDPFLGTPRGSSRGHITQVADRFSTTKLKSTYTYDVLGRAFETEECIDAKCYQLRTAFDPAGRLQKLIYPDPTGHVGNASTSARYVYNEAGVLESIPGFISTMAHNATGQTTSILFANDVEETRTYNAQRGWLDTITVENHTGRRTPAIFQQTLTHDLAGRVNQQAVQTLNAGYQDYFAHDDLGRLTSVTSNDPTHNGSFDYDLNGNFRFHSLLGSVSYQDAKHVHAITDTGNGEHYTYDDAGQMLSSNELQLTWNDEHRPTSINNTVTGVSTALAYDDNGRRVQLSTAGAQHLSPDPLLDVDPAGAITDWIMAEGRRVVRVEGSRRYTLHEDALGSVRVITDQARQLADSSDFDSWGRETPSATQTDDPYRFAGSRFDQDTGLDYMNARYYAPGLARFISPDPVIPELYAPQSLNRYSYALNDPVGWVDPSGYQSEPIDAADLVLQAPANSSTDSSLTAPAAGDSTTLIVSWPDTPTNAAANILSPKDTALAPAWVFGAQLTEPNIARQGVSHSGLQFETSVPFVAADLILQGRVPESWVSGDAAFGVGVVKPLQAGGFLTIAAGILSGSSGTDIPFYQIPADTEKVNNYHINLSPKYNFNVDPSLPSFLQTWTWFDPDPSAGVHIKYDSPVSATQSGFTLGATVGFSPPGLPNMTPNNANFPHAAGDLGGVGDWAASLFFQYNQQIDAGYGVFTRFYVLW